MALVNIGTRLQSATIERLDALIPRLAARVPGSNMTRADVVRAAVERGVDALEAELTPLPPQVAQRQGGGKQARKK